MAAVPNTSAAQIADNVINFQYKKCVPRMRVLGFFFVPAFFRRPCAAPPTAPQFSAMRQHDLPFPEAATSHRSLVHPVSSKFSARRWFFKKDKVADVLVPALAEFVGSAFFIFLACGAGMNTVNFAYYAGSVQVQISLAFGFMVCSLLKIWLFFVPDGCPC